MKRAMIIGTILISILTSVTPVYSRWKKNPNINHAVYCFVSSKTKIFAGSDSMHIFCSSDGNKWTLLRLQSVPDPLGSGNITAMAALGDTIAFGTDRGTIYITTNNGEGWNYVFWPGRMVLSLAFNGTTLFVSTNDQVMFSPDLGITWKMLFKDYGANGFMFSPHARMVGNWFSIDSGKSWVNFECGNISTSLIRGQEIYVGGNGICISNDSGIHWIHENNCCGLIDYGIVTSLIYSDSNIFMSGANYFESGYGGVLMSTNKGLSWTNMNNDTNDFNWDVHTLIAYSGKIFAGRDSGIWVWDTTSSTNAIKIDPAISLSPNPTTSLLYIRNAPENLAGITILNVLGEKVMEIAATHSSDFTIDLSNLPAGLYYARFAAPNSLEVRKIIKE
jgi:hypothetical protein